MFEREDGWSSDSFSVSGSFASRRRSMIMGPRMFWSWGRWRWSRRESYCVSEVPVGVIESGWQGCSRLEFGEIKGKFQVTDFGRNSVEVAMPCHP